jgi:hypothetical protein
MDRGGKKLHIYKIANINVPHQYKTKYEDLILRHFKIVSIGKNYLGRFLPQDSHEGQRAEMDIE